MKKENKQLRELAEERVNTEFNKKIDKSSIDTEKLINDLRIHQAELEIQNEELKKTQTELELSRDIFAQLYNQSPVGYVTLNKIGIIIRANITFLNMLKILNTNIRGRAFSDLIHPNDKAAFLARFKAFFKQPENKSIELKLLTDSNTETYVRIEGKSVFDIEADKKEQQYLFLAIMDINKEKRAELALLTAKQEAEKANASKSNFLALMSHEIRTPLNGIKGFISLLLKEVQNPDHIEMLQIVENCGNLLLSILNDILDLSKIEAGQLELEYNPFSIEALLASINSLGLGLLAASGKTIQLKFQKDSKLEDYILGDSTRIFQIMNNLLSNAIKFTHEGFIEFGVRVKDNNFVEYYVKDTGIGIPKNKIHNIFNPFFQVKDIKSHTESGTGLGLAIAKNLVHLMQGNIKVESETGNFHGSKFYFILPYEPSKNPNIEIQKGNRIFKKSLSKILVVEDNKVNMILTKKILEKLGSTVLEAENGLEAVKIFSSEPDIHIIFMDIQMPVMDGLSATKEIRKLEKNSKPQKPVIIIAITAAAMRGDKEECLYAGCDDYLTKPINLTQLENIIEKYDIR